MDIETFEYDLTDIANFEFREEFSYNYKFSKLQFYSGNLQECANDVVQSKRPLLLYLHHGNTKFSEHFCQLISKTGIEKLISDNYYLMGWNINNKQLNRSRTLQCKSVIINSIKLFVEAKEPCIFFIVPNGLYVIELEEERIHGEVDELSLITALTKIKQLLSRYITQDYFISMTSVKYQQWMYDELSDRDYDSFEKNEHHLLKDKILFAMYGPPRKLANGGIGYEEKEMKEANEVYKQIRKVNNETTKWNDRVVISFIYNCAEPLDKDKQKKIEANRDYNPDEDFRPAPVFGLRRCKKYDPQSCIEPCRRFIDSSCRVYKSWNDYLENNTLPPSKMIYPKNGKYRSDDDYDDDVRLEYKFSPSCSGLSKTLRYTDIGSGVVGLASSAIFVAAMFTPLAAVAVPAAMIGGGATGAYAVGRSANTLVDRKAHKLSIGMKNAESRAAYFNIAAGTVGAIGAGATAMMTNSVESGAQIGKGIQYTVNALNGANIITSGTATVNSYVDVFLQYSEDGEGPSALTLAQLGSSLFFFGNSVYNFRTAAQIINNTQASRINEISESLRSNKHRKAFNKLVKESVRTQGPVKGQAEVISTMKNVGAARDDIIATLVRSNKNFKENGIRFAARDGGITLNGVKVDILSFGSMPTTQQAAHMESLPSIPESSMNLRSTTNIITNMKLKSDLMPVLSISGVLNPSVIIRMLHMFKEKSMEKILRIYQNFMNHLDINLVFELLKLLSGNVSHNIMKYIVDFIRIKANNLLEEFTQTVLNEDVIAACQKFGFTNVSVTIADFREKVIDEILNPSGRMMSMLKEEFQTWCASLAYKNEIHEEIKRQRHEGQGKRDIYCNDCGGYYYI